MTTQEDKLKFALYDLLEWAAGNRGSKQGNPYMKREIKHALETLAESCGHERGAWLEAKEIYKKQAGI